jgi:hypothetical protein
MELLLNIVWLTVALLALSRFGVWAAGEADRRKIVLVGVATVCALAVLFPIVSMSDDMQTTVAAVEETAAVRRIVLASALQLAPAVVVAALTSLSLVVIALTVLGFTTEYAFALPGSLDAPVFSLRGPPSFGC